MAFFGFCVIYMLRVNLSVAIVAMTSNKTRTEGNVTIVVVCANVSNILIAKSILAFCFRIPTSLGSPAPRA